MALFNAPQMAIPQTVEINLSAGKIGRVAMRFPWSEQAEESGFDLRIGHGDVMRALSLANTYVTDSYTRGEPYDPLRQIGTELYDMLFGRRMERALKRAFEETDGTSLRLRVAANDLEYETLPWEFMYDGTFLNLSIRTPIVRRNGQPIPGLRSLDNVRVLVISASSGFPKHQMEQQVIRDAAEPVNNVSVTFLEHITVPELRAQLEHEAFDVLHYIGPGTAATGRREQFLAFADDVSDSTAYLDADMLQTILSGTSLRLVFLNEGETNFLASIINRHVPAVIGLQGQMDKQTNAVFVESFYQTLFNGRTLEAAVTEARKAVDLSMPGTREWGLPELYNRGDQVPFLQMRPTDHVAAQRSSHTYDAAKSAIEDPEVARQHKKALWRLRILEKNRKELVDRQMMSSPDTADLLQEELDSVISEIDQLQGTLPDFEDGGDT